MIGLYLKNWLVQMILFRSGAAYQRKFYIVSGFRRFNRLIFMIWTGMSGARHVQTSARMISVPEDAAVL